LGRDIPELRLTHRGVTFTVKPSARPGFYWFEFRIADQLIRGKVETRLAGMAVRRARRAIDRRLKPRIDPA